jgi:hypothetical protein
MAFHYKVSHQNESVVCLGSNYARQTLVTVTSSEVLGYAVNIPLHSPLPRDDEKPVTMPGRRVRV